MPKKETSDHLLDQGMATRRNVLGDVHVDAAILASNDFDDDFQEYINKAAWGLVWSRPGLTIRDRSLITITQLASLGHWDEFTLHIKASIHTGVTRSEVKEAILHVALYAGVPAANKASKIAKSCYETLNTKD